MRLESSLHACRAALAALLLPFDQRYAALVGRVKAMGYDTSPLVTVPQRASPGRPASGSRP
ncbi:MAG: hypothetical protein ACKOE3_11670 [Betaproteobacteria bacterium]